MESTMEHPISATLHIVPEVAQAYRALYTIVYDGAAATPLKMHGAETLQACLTQLQVPAHDIATIITRLKAGRSYILDLQHMDRDTVTSVLLTYAR